MRSNVKTLRNESKYSIGRNELQCGWGGLKTEIKSFFNSAKAHCAVVLKKQEDHLKKSLSNVSSSASATSDP